MRSKKEVERKLKAPMADHWLTFNSRRTITGCHCGFKVHRGCDCEDCTYGDPVVRHVAAEAIREAVMAWAEVAPDNGETFTRAEVADVLFRHADSLDGGPQ